MLQEMKAGMAKVQGVDGSFFNLFLKKDMKYDWGSNLNTLYCVVPIIYIICCTTMYLYILSSLHPV